MLGFHEVAHYLFKRHLLSPQTVVDGALVVGEIGGRNRSFSVVVESRSAFLLKQGIWPAGLGSVANEAAVYRFIVSEMAPDFEPYVPHFVDFDPEENILILEFVRNSRNLREYYSSTENF